MLDNINSMTSGGILEQEIMVIVSSKMIRYQSLCCICIRSTI